MGHGRAQLFDVHVTEFGADRASLQEVLRVDEGEIERFMRATPTNVREALPELEARELVERLRSFGARVALLPSTADTASLAAAPVAGDPVARAPLASATTTSSPPRTAPAVPAIPPPPLQLGGAGPVVIDPAPAGAATTPPGSSQSQGAQRLQMAVNPGEFVSHAPTGPTSLQPGDGGATDATLPFIEPLLSAEERRERDLEQQRRQAERRRAGAATLGLDPNSLMPNLPDVPSAGPGLPALPTPGNISNSLPVGGPSLELDDSIPTSRRPSQSSVPPATVFGDDDSSMPPALGGEMSLEAPAPSQPGPLRTSLMRMGEAANRGVDRARDWAEDVEREDEIETVPGRVRTEFAVFLIWLFDFCGPWMGRVADAVGAPGGRWVERADRALDHASGRSTPDPDPEPAPEAGPGRWPPPRYMARRRDGPEPEPTSPRALRGGLLLVAAAVLFGGVHWDRSIFWGNANLMWMLLHAFAFFAIGIALFPRRG